MKRVTTSTPNHGVRRTLAGPHVLALALGCFAGAGVLRAGPDSLPDAATILDKYVEVTGGQAAYEKIHNRVTKGRVVHVGMGFEDQMTRYQARPNKTRLEADSEALGKIQSGTDGDVAWYLSSMTGPLVEDGMAKATALRDASFDRDLQWRRLYKKAECVGEEVVDGKACYEVVLTPNEGDPETRYYDKESGLLAKMEKMRLMTGMPPMPVEVTFSDYKWVDGLLLAHRAKQAIRQCGTTREMLFVSDSIEHNVELPADRFDPPSQIMAVVKTGRRGKPVVGAGGCGSAATVASQQGGAGPAVAPPGCGGATTAAAKQGSAQPKVGPGGCGGGGLAAPTQDAKQPMVKGGGCGGS